MRERAPSLDFTSLDAVSRTLAGLFWARIEALSPAIDTLRLPPAPTRAWKQELQTKRPTDELPAARRSTPLRQASASGVAFPRPEREFGGEVVEDAVGGGLRGAEERRPLSAGSAPSRRSCRMSLANCWAFRPLNSPIIVSSATLITPVTVS
jgi:hypothetical protein